MKTRWKYKYCIGSGGAGCDDDFKWDCYRWELGEPGDTNCYWSWPPPGGYDCDYSQSEIIEADGCEG